MNTKSIAGWFTCTNTARGEHCSLAEMRSRTTQKYVKMYKIHTKCTIFTRSNSWTTQSKIRRTKEIKQTILKPSKTTKTHRAWDKRVRPAQWHVTNPVCRSQWRTMIFEIWFAQIWRQQNQPSRRGSVNCILKHDFPQLLQNVQKCFSSQNYCFLSLLSWTWT